ncbi:TIGR00255 family protein [Alteribacillus bidgolensis]|uniref:TIGR00255 family protein n=2 Tax=Alteribacillus bidgolensis TaxID=930129 RepID=A0A1G8GBW0_9BACI|nr:TIGR00255 family protein [Alteribacillus bidgolensis]
MIDMSVSMTGFGRAILEQDGGSILVEMKSVNHRFCDIQFRMPRQLLSLEDRLRKCVLEKVERGKIDVFITLEGISPSTKEVNVDWSLLDQYIDQAEELDRLNVFESKLRLQDFLLHPDIAPIEESPQMKEEWQEAIEKAVSKAANELHKMRVEEGIRLQNDVRKRIENMHHLTSQLQEQAPEVVSLYRERLYERIREFIDGEYEPDETRLLQEVAFFAEKINVDEELTRLFSHYDQFILSLEADGAKGRKLDFLGQEMNREINTIGSKANSASLSHLVVDLKSELEKVKEQVQNIE